MIDRFKHHYGELSRAQNSVGYSSCALFCQLEISEEDIKKNLPDEELRTGLFETSGTYDGVCRFNTTTDSAARMSLRLNIPQNVGGNLLEECAPSAYPNNKYKQIDLLLAEELKEFPFHEYQDLSNLMGLKENFVGFLWSSLSRFGTTISSIMNAKHAKEVINHNTGLVAKSYYGGLPFKIGKDSAMKWAMFPKQTHELSEDEKTTTEVEKSAISYTSSLKKWMETNKDKGGAKWDFVIQIAKNTDGKDETNDDFNIEYGDAKWDEMKSPYVKVGTLTIKSDQPISRDTKLNQFFHPNDTSEKSCPEYNAIQFNPWNQLQAHQPLGPFNRARKAIYPVVSKLRRSYGNKEEIPKLCPFLEYK